MPRHPKVSATTHGLTSRVFSALVPRIQAYSGEKYPLHVGDTWLEPPECARSETLSTAEHPGLHTYPPPPGMPELIEAVANKLQRRYGVERTVDQIQVMPGATGAFSAICQSLLDPGDEVIIPTPFWPLIRGIVAARGGVPVQVPFYTHLSDPDFDPAAALDAAVTDRTVAIYLNSPNNPTGVTLDEAQLDAVAEVAKRHDLWVWTDEVYEDLYMGDAPPPPPLWARPDMADRTIASHSLSKAYALAGARVGYTHGPSEVMSVIRDVQTFATYSAPKPMQVLAARALNEGDTWLAETRSLYQQQARLAAAALEMEVPSGATFLFFDAKPYLAAGDESAIPLLTRCIDEAGLILVPGAATGVGYERWIRLCFTSVAPAPLERALAALRRVLGLES